MAFCSLKRTLLPLLALCIAVPTRAAPISASAPLPSAVPIHLPKIVAYDAKDKRYYSVAYAKAHAMHDKGDDLLTIILSSTLP